MPRGWLGALWHPPTNRSLQPRVYYLNFAVGDYDVEIPSDTEAGDYKIRVGRFEDETLYGCSGTFSIMGSDDMSMSYDF